MQISTPGTAADEVWGFVSGQSTAAPPDALGRYRVAFPASSGIGETIHAPSEAASLSIDPGDLLAQPAVIPLGDIDGDGFGDFIGSVVEDLGSSEDLLEALSDSITHPADLVGPTEARVFFGSSTGIDLSRDAGRTTILLPAPLLQPSNFGSRSVIASPGDFDDDGINDLVVSVSLVDGCFPGRPFQGAAVYILLGDELGGWSGPIDIASEFDTRISGLEGQISVSNVGDTNGDGIDDLAVSSQPSGLPVGAAHIFHGSPFLSGTDPGFEADFSDPGVDGFLVTERERPIYGIPPRDGRRTRDTRSGSASTSARTRDREAGATSTPGVASADS
jgi:hypothetical protein